MLERINLIIKTKNLSASQFADKVGVQRSSVSHVLSGRNKPSLEFIQKVLRKFPDIRSEWLLFGKGTMTNTTDLFSSISSGKSTEESLNDMNDINSVSIQGSDESGIKTTPLNSTIGVELTKAKANSNKTIERIVLFYTDNSFTEYKPE